MCVLPKFQLRILKDFEVTVLQSSNNRKIVLYSKYRENKLQALKLFLLLPFITAKKVEIHEETSITNNRFDVTWIIIHNLQFLWPTAIKQKFSSSSCLYKLDDTQVLTVSLFLHQEQGV